MRTIRGFIGAILLVGLSGCGASISQTPSFKGSVKGPDGMPVKDGFAVCVFSGTGGYYWALHDKIVRLNDQGEFRIPAGLYIRSRYIQPAEAFLSIYSPQWHSAEQQPYLSQPADNLSVNLHDGRMSRPIRFHCIEHTAMATSSFQRTKRHEGDVADEFLRAFKGEVQQFQALYLSAPPKTISDFKNGDLDIERLKLEITDQRGMQAYVMKALGWQKTVDRYTSNVHFAGNDAEDHVIKTFNMLLNSKGFAQSADEWTNRVIEVQPETFKLLQQYQKGLKLEPQQIRLLNFGLLKLHFGHSIKQLDELDLRGFPPWQQQFQSYLDLANKI